MRNENTKKIFLWSSPRNVSTALMYSFAERQDTRVYDEPLYGYYLKHTDADKYHPGAEKIIEQMETDGHKVIDFMLEDSDSTICFYKNMTNHLCELPRKFIYDAHNILLTRDPKDMLLSYIKVIPSPVMRDIGYKQQYELYEELNEKGKTPIVLDAERLSNNPEKQLRLLCRLLDISFTDEMLQWEKGPRKEDGIWAQYYYEGVHSSTGFRPYSKKDESLPEEHQALYEKSLFYYEQLKGEAIHV